MWFDKAIVLSKEKHEVEARLKTCLAVREDELHYAKQDAVRSIRAVYEKYKGSENAYAFVNLVIPVNHLWNAIRLTIEEIEGKENV